MENKNYFATLEGAQYDTGMTAKDRLLEQFPGARVDQVEQHSDQATFEMQKQKLLAHNSPGGAIGVVWLRGQIVLAERTQLHPGWAIVGGTVEGDHGYPQTFLREVKEETGLDVEIKRLLMIEEKTFISPKGERLDVDLAVFEAVARDDQEVQATEEAKIEGLTVKLFDPDKLPDKLILRDREKIEMTLQPD